MPHPTVCLPLTHHVSPALTLFNSLNYDIHALFVLPYAAQHGRPHQNQTAGLREIWRQNATMAALPGLGVFRDKATPPHPPEWGNICSTTSPDEPDLLGMYLSDHCVLQRRFRLNSSSGAFGHRSSLGPHLGCDA